MSAASSCTGAALARGQSRQDYGTPPEFLAAVRGRFGQIAVDLAASRENAATGMHLGEGGIASDALAHNWRELEGLLWLNPPFANIGPWAEKCAACRDRRDWLTMLAPASVGTEWYAEHVHGKALVLFLRPRLKFVGCRDPYPKDLMLCAYGFGASGFEPWRWDR